MTMKFSTLEIDNLLIRTGVKPGSSQHTPLFLFNGIGANQELLSSFIQSKALADIEIITFDVPGTGGSTTPRLPYRLPSLVRLASRVLDQLGYGQVDVLGLSWGGALAQQFAKDRPDRCRRLILAATNSGLVSVPPKLSVVLKMVTPRRYLQPSYLERIGASIYGGVFRHDKKHLKTHRAHVIAPSIVGYFFQLCTISGWTSIHWLHQIRQPTLIMAGDDDPLIPIKNAKYMASRIPNSQLEVMHCGHMFMLTLSTYTAEVVSDFLCKPEYQVRTKRAAM